MPAVCKFYGLDPDQFDRLSWDDLRALIAYREQVQRDEQRAMEQMMRGLR